MFDMPDVLINHKGLTSYMKTVLNCEAIHRSLEERHMYPVYKQTLKNEKINLKTRLFLRHY